MTVIQSAVSTRTASYRDNRAAMLELLGEVRRLEAKVRSLSSSKKDLFTKRQQILPRARVATLLDKGSPWLEFSTLCGLGMHEDDGQENVFGGCLIAGIGYVSGVRCAVYANDSAIKGGMLAPASIGKVQRLQTIAMENKLPFVGLIESAGGNLTDMSDSFVPGGGMFYRQGKLSALGLPQIAVVHGSSTAGGAYIPGMSDYSILVKNNAKVFLAGAPLVKAATGEEADEQQLGGADMHTQVSGVGDFFAQDDRDGLRIAREIVAKLGWNEGRVFEEPKSFQQPRYDIDEICGIVPVDYRQPYDVREVIARVVDGSDFLDFKPRYGSHTVCGWSEIEGYACGLIGNNGPIDPDGAAKAAQFIQLCCQTGTPLVFLQNTTGFLVGTHVERSGLVKHGSKFIQAVANAPVAKITLMIGASYGAGNYAMCGRAFEPRFVFGWPNHRVAVMGGEQAAMVMDIIARRKAARSGVEPDEAALQAQRELITIKMDAASSALYATARVWDDGLIDPRDTRKILAMTLSINAEAERRDLNPNTFGIARM